MLMYSVKKCFSRSEVFEKDFPNIPAAEKYIQNKLLQDIQLKVNASYRIYEGSDLVKELKQSDAVQPNPSSSDSQQSSSSSKQGNEQVFSPTPLPTSPRPPGMPQNWKPAKKEDDDKEEG